MRNWILGLSTSLVLMAAPAVAFAATPAHAIINEPFTISQIACNGDTFVLSGTAHGTANVVVSNDGSTHLVASVTLSDVHGTDQVTGTKYVAQGSGLEQANMTVSSTGAATMVLRAQLISQGSAPNVSETIYAHMTVNANGTVTVDNMYTKTTAC